MLGVPRIGVAGGTCLALGAAAAGQPASFHGLGNPPSTPNQFVSVSADGSTVVGFTTRFGSSPNGWRWTAATGLVSLGEVTFRAEAVSADGAVIAGAWSGLEAVRWTQGVGFVPQGVPSSYADWSEATGISADGEVMVGAGGRATTTLCFPGSFVEHYMPETRAFRQDRPGGALRRLNPLAGYSSSWAWGVSGDGSLVIGESVNMACGLPYPFGSAQACAWSGNGGPLPLGTMNRAYAASFDGSVIVGVGNGFSRAVRWVGGVAWDLGTIPGYSVSEARAVSADGSVVVGVCGTNYPTGAFVWDPVLGMRELRAALVNEYGLNLGAWTLTAATGISADGRTLVGVGINPQGVSEPWMAFLGDPIPVCYANCDGSTAAPALNVNDFACFLNRFGAGDSYANCDQSTAAPVLNIADFSCFLNAFAAGCS